ncbi:NAD(P)/FAD-dependent oxidoreductase [Lactobacillus sp. ESL0228]|uniref:NAD(P)/FAD-dependent oxidoreductase n=1 Tax=Lactobacillus sp. ESL0228 TaxID=2069352 RepID=UPI00351550FF
MIGAGPVGLFCTSFANLHGLKTVTFDSLKKVGGQPQMLYPFKKIFDIPVFNQITGAALIQQLHLTAKKNSDFVLDHKVRAIQKHENIFIIDNEFETRSVVIATGNGAFSPRKFPLKMSEAVEKKVHYFIKEPHLFTNQTIGIFGGGDSALDWALELASQNNTHVKIIHRRNEFRGLEKNVQQLKSLKNVEIITPYLPNSIAIRNNQLEVELKQISNKEIISHQFDQIIVAYGFRSNNNFVSNWGINLVNGQIKVSREMTTNVPGIYAIGDAVTYPGRVPVIALGFGEAQIAVTSIMRFLFPEKTLTVHSTSL